MLQIKLSLLATLCCLNLYVFGQTDPEIISWKINTTGALGYNNLPSDVQEVWYTNGFSFVKVTDVPAYSIGPWMANPNDVAVQDKTYRIDRTPTENTGTLVSVGLGAVGIWSNGVFIFNYEDGRSYNNEGAWFQDALIFEGVSFDNCLGHPNGQDAYHHHVNPTCMYDDQASTVHSPIVGYMWDGFPIYGPYSYANTNGTGGITRMISGYELRTIAARTHHPDGTDILDGPPIDIDNPLGNYIEDYEHTGTGHLDQHNGRFAITPEYLSGTYAYYVTIDAGGDPQFPYVIGPTYYGTTTPNNGTASIPGMATQYIPTALPVELVAFNVNLRQTTEVHFDWLTATERNNDYFVIEKSQDGNSWKDIGRVTGAGESQITQQYAFIDKQPDKGTSYYRLKQVDFDGKNTYSEAQSIYYNPIHKDVSVFANPVLIGEPIKIKLNSEAEVILYDLMGKTVYQRFANEGLFEIQTNNFPVGSYILSVKIEGDKVNQIIMVQ